MPNQQPVPPNNMIDTNSMNELATKMENNLSHATQIINDTLAHSRQLMAQIQHVHQQNQAHYEQASSQLQDSQQVPHQSAPGGGTNPVSDPVASAVSNLAQQEQGLFQHMQQQAQQHFQHAGQTLGGSQPQTPHAEQHHGIHGFADSVAATLHHGVEKGESLIHQMKLDAQKHMHDAEKSIQQSLSSIHHAIEGQGQMFAQQHDAQTQVQGQATSAQVPQAENPPAEPPPADPNTNG
ncbi:hypothetical protein EYS14_00970 [Alteromonadaceae bacterium M269]|nr:hypothetical protein EYS14_00970 [Alteromonadaceae bacterium M269]